MGSTDSELPDPSSGVAHEKISDCDIWKFRKAEYLRRFRRSLLSISSIGFAFLAIVIVALKDNASISYWVLWIAFGILCFQAGFDYRKRSYDSALALKIQDIWNDEKSKKIRHDAAKALLNDDYITYLCDLEKYKTQLDPIDDILDILIDIGFLLEGDQMSSRVAHHYFHHWVQGYWCSAHDYIKRKQDKDRRSLWQSFESLFEATSFIEYTRNNHDRRKLWSIDSSIFLNEEIIIWEKPHIDMHTKEQRA